MARKNPAHLELEESYEQMRKVRKSGCRMPVVSSQGDNLKARRERKLHPAQFELLRRKWGNVN